MVRGKATSLLIALFLSFSTLLLIGNSTVAAHTAYIATPAISITVTSPANTNYSSSVPLVFILPINGTFDLPFGIEVGTGGNGRGVWGIKGYSYSVDGHSNVSIAGNITLNGLAEGEHRIVVYVHRWCIMGFITEVLRTPSRQAKYLSRYTNRLKIKRATQTIYR